MGKIVAKQWLKLANNICLQNENKYRIIEISYLQNWKCLQNSKFIYKKKNNYTEIGGKICWT